MPKRLTRRCSGGRGGPFGFCEFHLAAASAAAELLVQVAFLKGVILMFYILDLQNKGLSRENVAVQGALIRFRSVLITALMTGLRFVAMALSTSAGGA